MDSTKKSHVVLDVLGPTVEFLVLPSEWAGDYAWSGASSHAVSPSLFTVIRTTRVFFYALDSFRLWSSTRINSNGSTWRRGDFRHLPHGSSTRRKTNSTHPRAQSM